MRLFHSSIIILFIFLFMSCAEVQFPEFVVEDCTFTSDSVEITFSNEPNQYLFINSFSIKEDSDDVIGLFEFSDTKAIFYPNDGIKNNYLYEITITTNAEDTNGNSLEKDYKTTYTTRTEFVRPSIVNIIPGHETQTDNGIEEIIIEFSEPIDDVSFRNSLSFSPSFDYTYSWDNNGTTVHIFPTAKLNRETRYEIKISTTLMDKNRNTLLNEYRSTFLNYVDTDIPTFTLSYDDNGSSQFLNSEKINKNIKTDEKLILTFSESINIEYVSSYIEIYPSLNVNIIPDKNTNDKATIEFTKDMEWGNTYRLTIFHGLKDFANNEIKTDCHYDITFDHEDNRPITIKKVLIDLQNPANNYFELENFGSLSFEPLYFSTSDPTPVQTNVYCIFDISKNAEKIIGFSIMESFGIDFSNACFESITTKKVNVLTESEIFADAKLKQAYDSISDFEGKLCVVSLGLEIVNSTTSNIGTLKFTMDNKVRDSLGNLMLDEYSCQVNKL